MTNNAFRTGNVKASKLTATQVIDMRTLYHRDGVTQSQLSREFGISIIQVGRIVRGESWQHVPMEARAQDLKDSARRLFDLQQELATPGLDKLQALAADARKGDTLVEELLSENASVADKAKRFLGEG